MLNLVLNFDAQALAAPQSFRDAMLAAALNLEKHIANNITVNINVGYGENSGTPLPVLPGVIVSNGGPGPTANGVGFDLSYTDLRAALAAHNTSATDATVLANLPTADNIEGQTNFRIGNAQARALGLVSTTDGTIDGAIGMGTGFVGDALFSAALHEFTHAMGRVANWNNVDWSVDLFRFDPATLNSATHTRVFGGDLPDPNDGNPPPAHAAYFSIDGGVTRLADFGVASDPGDFLNTGVQGFDAFNENVSGAPAGLTLLDLIFMDALGFQVSNQAPTITALVNTISEDDPSYSRNLLDNASDPEADPISVKNLDASVLTSGGRTLTSGLDYTLSGSTINLTGFGFGEFQSLAVNQTDTVVFHYNVTDSLTASTSDTLTLTVNGANDPPKANPDVGTAGENETKLFDVLANDTDVDAVHSFTLLSPLVVDLVTSANSQVNGINASSAFTIVSNQIQFTPGTLFDHLALGQTAQVLVHYTMADDQGAQASSVLTLTVTGANDPPVIISGGGGDNATYDLKVNFSAITTVVATDVDSGSILSYSIVGGADANLFKIDANTGALAFKVKPVVPHNGYEVLVQASDQDGGIDKQLITVNVTSSKMDGELPGAGADTFVFHSGFGSNSVDHFQQTEDFLQFDKGMFSANTAAAVLAAATDDNHGNTVIFDLAGDRVILMGVTKADLTVHQNDILFV